MSDSLWSRGPQHARPPCPSPTPRFYPNSYPFSWWCHPTISSSVVPFSSCLQFFPASGALSSFPTKESFSLSFPWPFPWIPSCGLFLYSLLLLCIFFFFFNLFPDCKGILTALSLTLASGPAYVFHTTDMELIPKKQYFQIILFKSLALIPIPYVK